MPVYQDKKTKLWSYRVYATNEWEVRKQYEKKGFRTKKEAQSAEIELLETFKRRKEELKEENNNSNILFEELWVNYEKYIRLKQKRQSYRKTVSKFNNHILPYFSKYPINKINASVYTRWQIEIESKGYKHKYNTSLHSSMVTILNYAIKFYDLKENIASKIGNFSKKNELSKNVDFWTLEEFNKFIDVVDDNVYKLFFETLYYTGLRQGECLALTWNDFQDNYLNINKTISKEKVDGEYIINTPKTPGSIRKVSLDDDLIQKLKEFQEVSEKMIGFEKDWFIFYGLNPLSPTTIARKKNTYCEKSGVKKIRIHDFRHSHASLLLSLGVPITVISKRLGHTDINMTLNTYSHLIPKDEDKAITILNSIKMNMKKQNT